MPEQMPFLTLLVQGFLCFPDHNAQCTYKDLCWESWDTYTLSPYRKKKPQKIHPFHFTVFCYVFHDCFFDLISWQSPPNPSSFCSCFHAQLHSVSGPRGTPIRLVPSQPERLNQMSFLQASFTPNVKVSPSLNNIISPVHPCTPEPATWPANT